MIERARRHHVDEPSTLRVDVIHPTAARRLADKRIDEPADTMHRPLIATRSPALSLHDVRLEAFCVRPRAPVAFHDGSRGVHFVDHVALRVPAVAVGMRIERRAEALDISLGSAFKIAQQTDPLVMMPWLRHVAAPVNKWNETLGQIFDERAGRSLEEPGRE